MKSVIVTGGLGFIFSNFIELLLKKRYRVINVDKITYASNVDFKPNSKNYSFVKEDTGKLRDIPCCDYIINAAAESAVDKSIVGSKPFLDSNIVGTYNLLELLRNKKIESMQYSWEYKDPIFVQISTDEVHRRY